MTKTEFLASLKMLKYQVTQNKKIYFINIDVPIKISLLNTHKNKGVCLVQRKRSVNILSNITKEYIEYPTHRFYLYEKALKYACTAE